MKVDDLDEMVLAVKVSRLPEDADVVEGDGDTLARVRLNGPHTVYVAGVGRRVARAGQPAAGGSQGHVAARL